MLSKPSVAEPVISQTPTDWSREWAVMAWIHKFFGTTDPLKNPLKNPFRFFPEARKKP